jgi:hypothetical protein
MAIEFDSFERRDLYEILPEAWNGYYGAMRPWLEHEDSDVRRRAINRLLTAVCWAEPNSFVRARNAGMGAVHEAAMRASWLLNALEAAHAAHNDIVPTFLHELRFHHASGPFRDLLLRWIERLLDDPPPGVAASSLEGALLLQHPFDEDDPADVARVVALLDHASHHVRACAARTLSGLEGEALAADAMFALIAEKEIARPGIAGPYWSEWHMMGGSVPVNPIDWMMHILEHRNGPEPEDMSFNGIDFYLHEVCCTSPEMVLRMMRLGHADIAIETATEIDSPVEGMAPVLRELAKHPRNSIGGRARMHLAMYYRVFCADAQDGSIRRWPHWSPDADVFSFHSRETNAPWLVVIYPSKTDDWFTDEQAWALIDRALPPSLREGIVFHPLDRIKEVPPGPFRLNDKLLWHFGCGASLEMSGQPEARSWSRLQITSGRLAARWNPLGQR